MFLPFLQCLADGTTRHVSEIREYVANHLKLSLEDCEELIPSGQATKLANRVGWARTHLSKAGLIERAGDWGIYRITDAGRAIVNNPPPVMNLRFLDTIPAHYAWFHAGEKKSPETTSALESIADNDQPPNERIEEAFAELNAELRAELLASMLKMDPFRFEHLVLELLQGMGYGGSGKGSGWVTKKGGDGGIDGIINEDRLGLDVIYVQAKRWQNNVGTNEIRNFIGRFPRTTRAKASSSRPATLFRQRVSRHARCLKRSFSSTDSASRNS